FPWSVLQSRSKYSCAYSFSQDRPSRCAFPDKFLQLGKGRSAVDKAFRHADALLHRFRLSCDIEGRASVQADRTALCALIGSIQDRPRDRRVFLRQSSLELSLLAAGIC